MHKLFVLSHLRTLTRLGISEFSPLAWEEAVARNTLVPSGEGLLYRLPRQELKHAMNTVCPINSLEQPFAEEIILASKALRSNLKTDEVKHCARCPFVQQCSHAKKPHSPPPPEQVNSLRDLVLYSHGLQQLLKPDSIYYRQWVAAYRLGDSIIASIDDLSKGGQEIAEYDRIRLEGMRAYQEKMALKKGQPRRQGEQGEQGEQLGKEGASVEKRSKKEGRLDGQEQAEVEEFQDLFKRVDAVAGEKSKLKPKAKVAPKVGAAPKEGQESFGRDFSFDQEAEFQPTQKKFTKKSVEKNASIEGKKGYQRIERDEGRPDKERRPSYNKFNPEREPIEGFEEDYARFKPKGDNRKPYDNRGDRGDRPRYDRDDRKERYDKNDRFERTDSGNFRGGNKYDRPQRNNDRGDWGNDRGQRGNQRGGQRDYRDNRGGKQERYGGEGRFQDRRGDQGYKSNYKSRDSNDDFPRIKQLSKNTQRDQRPRDSQEGYTPKPAKSNPYVSKWQPQDEIEPPRQSASRKTGDGESASRPKIIDMQSIRQGDEGAGRSSRRGRGRTGR